ncbi:MAG: hypothetical protein KBS52_04100 [Clostridiales bacterium]|nr:hypothetical protein [Candidatus Equinaster intestinalis]
MKSILILGAGQFAQVTNEIAVANGYEKIGFLDDHSVNAVGKLDEYANFVSDYEYAIVAIDDPLVRIKYTAKLKSAGFKVPALIHPTAYISPSAQIGDGCVVEPKAIIHTAATVEDCSIISVGAVINHHSRVCEACHISCNSTVMQNSMVKSATTTLCGQLYFVEPSLKNTDAWMANYSFDDGI